MNKETRVRFAPSPTGILHLGNARTAIFNWLYARKIGGTLILRIEDTDKERSKPEFEKDIIENLAWLGFVHDEFYRQSERADIHTRHLERMFDERKAFYCDHSTEELARELEAQKVAKEPPRHICNKRDAGLKQGIIRFKNDRREPLVIKDIIRGDIIYDPQLFGDFSLAKSISEPLYNFAVTVDDADMNITHVIRGEDHLTNTPKQMLVASTLGFSEPRWAHLPLLLGKDRAKLSKRHGALGVGEYRTQGYLAEALLNFIVLLGWHPADAEGEVFDKEKLIKLFSLERIQKGGAIADMKKLDWFNKEYIKHLPKSDIYERISAFAGNANELEYRELFFDAILPRLTRLAEAKDAIEALVHPPAYKKELLMWNGKIKPEKLKIIFEAISQRLDTVAAKDFQSPQLEAVLADLIEKEGKGTILWPLRAALSGSTASPGPFEIAGAIGKNETLARIQYATKILAEQ